MLSVRRRILIRDVLIDQIDWPTAISTIMTWAIGRHGRIVCVCNVHSVITSRPNPDLRAAINESDLATPDGMPIAWFISKCQQTKQTRINGPDLMVRLCDAAARQRVAVALYGSTESTIEKLRQALLDKFPRLRVAAMISPPFRELSITEDALMVEALNSSGAGIVFVGLGCPKQELWMIAHRNHVQAVMIGVGAAFDYLAGTVQRPPVWMQRAGLEWLGRLIAEPRRLWRRYFITNTIFILYILRELVLLKKTS